ncbi:hypothetical protein Q6D62_00910 [Corynebacterium diphtheriae]|uniref:hypothetical protein n=1 Tax=Corynebacterium diphtheriae TaxID=1717 RepID=UPI00026018E4|nr:hypothetical protein [Corynebacterium diphtheriae]EIK57185.1 hypothetical protein W5M_00828 [Corynebacterium diphtheriae bv. intermedius str. NCTC 5011]OJI02067.1 hypothetical protein BKD75_10115 [Corynebacterium diphtheriae]OKY20816.1 hypothetical protein AO271_05440 [Corynebacterium diphtheriae]OWM37413.1 hypothetical protein AZF05_04510 [Corynebacterium diphtheriae bv. intermedius]UEB38743.1 hypothetical protein LK425_10240 [Corynebacterium diphtheriae]
MSIIFNQRIEIIRAGEKRSVYSSDVMEDWDNPVVLPVEVPVSIQPVSSTESDATANRSYVTSRFRLFSPPGTDIPQLKAKDRVRIGLLVLDVVGDPARWPHPLKPATVHHVEADLEVHRG